MWLGFKAHWTMGALPHPRTFSSKHMCSEEQAAGLGLALVQLRTKQAASVTVEQISALASQFPTTGLTGLSAIVFHYPDSSASMALIPPASGLGSITYTSPRALQAPSLVGVLPHPNQQFPFFQRTPNEHPLWARRSLELC